MKHLVLLLVCCSLIGCNQNKIEIDSRKVKYSFCFITDDGAPACGHVTYGNIVFYNEYTIAEAQ